MDGLRDAISQADTVMTQPEIEAVAREVEGLLELYAEAIKPKETILTKANDIIHGDRLEHYGRPEVNFKRIAVAWTQFLSKKLQVVGGSRIDDEYIENREHVEITPFDVAMMMVLLKTMRMAEGYHSDSAMDIAGYTALAAILEGDDDL